jgi:hypothetical protein
MFSAKRTSRLVTIPTSLPDFSTTGIPLIRLALHQLQRVGEGLLGPHRDRVDDHPAFEALDRAHRRRLLLDRQVAVETPIPPSCARAIAMSASVTVSIAEDRIGMLSGISRVSRVFGSAWLGSTLDSSGCRRTSSNVRPSGMSEEEIRSAISAHDRRSAIRQGAGGQSGAYRTARWRLSNLPR